MYLGTPPDNEKCKPFDCFRDECYCSGLGEAPYGTQDDYCGALKHISGDTTFNQQVLNTDAVGFQVAQKHRRLVVVAVSSA